MAQLKIAARGIRSIRKGSNGDDADRLLSRRHGPRRLQVPVGLRAICGGLMCYRSFLVPNSSARSRLVVFLPSEGSLGAHLDRDDPRLTLTLPEAQKH